MQIHGDRDRHVIEQRGVVRDAGPVVVEGARVFQIADMLRQDRGAVLHQTERGLQFAAGGKQIRCGCEPGRQRNGGGREASCTTQDARHTRHHAHHRVIDPGRDGAVMRKHAVRETAKPRQRLVIVGDLRLVREVAAGHHDRMVDVAQQQQMQRRGRQHEAERPQTRARPRWATHHRSRAAARSAPRDPRATPLPRPTPRSSVG